MQQLLYVWEGDATSSLGCGIVCIEPVGVFHVKGVIHTFHEKGDVTFHEIVQQGSDF
jgi:hypothetical protein